MGWNPQGAQKSGQNSPGLPMSRFRVWAGKKKHLPSVVFPTLSSPTNAGRATEAPHPRRAGAAARAPARRQRSPPEAQSGSG